MSAGARNERAEQIASGRSSEILRVAQSPAVVDALAAAGAPAALLGSLIQTRSIPDAWRDAPAWTRGAGGVQCEIPDVKMEVGRVSVFTRAGLSEWAGVHEQAPASEPDGLRLRSAPFPQPNTGQSLATIICNWLMTVHVGEGLHALAMLVEFDGIGEDVEPETRCDKRILPRIQVREHRAREAGRLFGVHGVRNDAPQPTLPLFPDAPAAKHVPILDLMDAAGLPVMAKGQGAPLVTRLHVRVLATVRPADRHRPVVRLVLTAEELRRGLFGKRRRTRHWGKLQQALLHARDYAIHDGSGLWFPVALRRMPDRWEPAGEVVIDVAYPPGSISGPDVSLPNMDRLALDSAPRWRAYIAAHSLAWRPGSTRVKTRGGRFAWSRNADRYDVLTNSDRHRLAYGMDRKHRTRAEVDSAFTGLPGLRVLNMHHVNLRTGEVGWLVVPISAARAIGDPTREPVDPTREPVDPTREPVDPTRERRRKHDQ